VLVQSQTNGSILRAPQIFSFTNPVVAGRAIFVVVYVADMTGGGAMNSTCVDNLGNTYYRIGQAGGAAFNAGCVVWYAPNIVGGTPTITLDTTGMPNASGEVQYYEISGLGPFVATPGASQILKASNFNFNIPTGESILGAQVEVSGHQTTQPADAILRNPHRQDRPHDRDRDVGDRVRDAGHRPRAKVSGDDRAPVEVHEHARRQEQYDGGRADRPGDLPQCGRL